MIRSAKEFVELRKKNDPRATYDKALKSVWLKVIEAYPDYKQWVIRNKTIHASVLRLLAGDADADIRFEVATKRKCPHDVLEQLARDEDESIREEVARNAKTPPHVLDMLKTDPSETVTKALDDRMEQG